MIGAIIGDVVGSRFEFNNHLSKDFEFMTKECCYTDDTVMTCAIASVLMKCRGDYSRLTTDFIVSEVQKIGRRHPNCGYGARFIEWMFSKKPEPYNSCGNGSAMRISAVGFMAKNQKEVKQLSRAVTEISHDHPEGIKGAECTAMCIYFARKGKSKEEILKYVNDNYYVLDKTCDDYQLETKGQHGKEICQITVPQAIQCFAEGNSFEDVIRNCVYIGGDTDTIGAIAGAIAEAYYGVPYEYEMQVMKYLTSDLRQIVNKFMATVEA